MTSTIIYNKNENIENCYGDDGDRQVVWKIDNTNNDTLYRR